MNGDFLAKHCPLGMSRHVARECARRLSRRETRGGIVSVLGIAYKENPLLLLDGIPVFDPGAIVNYDPLRVEKIEIVTKRYFYGPLDVMGIISFTTYDGDAKNLPLQNATRKRFMGVQPRKIYYSPDYSTRRDALKRIPDYRVQLYWNPQVKVEKGKPVSLDFSTSDIEGEFEIIVKGVTVDGRSIHSSRIMRVILRDK